MFDASDFLIAEAIFPGLIVGYVECVCGRCEAEYSCQYNDEEEYPCPSCGMLNDPV